MSIATPLTAPPQRYSVVNWITCIVMVLFHVGAVAALFHFSWTLLVVSAALYWVAVGFGISLGYHRLHTHRSYQVPKWLDYFFAVCGTLTLEGGPIFWVATHRIHHQHSDTDSDPHTPKHGGFWAHMGWILFGEGHHNKTDVLAKYTPDLAADRFYRVLNTYHWVPLTVLGPHRGRHRWMARRLLGRVPSRCRGPARDVARQLRDAHVGLAAVRHQGRLEEQLVGGAHHVRRGVAQQPPRAPDLRAPRPGLVRARRLVDHDPDDARHRARQAGPGRDGGWVRAEGSGVGRRALKAADARLQPAGWIGPVA